MSCSHDWSGQLHIFWPLAVAKRSNIIKFQLRSQFQISLNKTLCVFSQMKDIKHIRRDFLFRGLGHAPGFGLWGTGGLGGHKLFLSKFNHTGV